MQDPDTVPQTGELFPLTEAQEGLWYAQRIDPDNPIFNTGHYADIRGALDVGAFRTAVDRVLGEADGLAIRVVDSDEGPRQAVDEQRRAALVIVDLRGHSEPCRAAHERMEADMATPLDPTRDPLTAHVLFRIADDRVFWYQRSHHLVIDAYGYALLMHRVCDLYAAAIGAREGRTSPFGSYAAVLAQDREYRSSAKREASRTFWMKEFGDRPEVRGLAPGEAVTARTYLRRDVPLPSLEAPLRALAAASDTPWPDLVTALCAAYVARHVGGIEVVVGVPSMERVGTAAVSVPAMVMNVLPFRVTIDEDAPLHDFVRIVSDRLRAQRRHGRYRSEQLRRDLGLVSHEHRLYGPLINVVPFERAPELPGAAVSVHTLGTGPVDDLTITLRGSPGGGAMALEIEANPRLYSQAQLSEQGHRLAVFLEKAVRAVRLADAPTLTPEEERRWLLDVNDTAHPVADTTLTALIEERMRRSPGQEALRFEEESLTYADLDRRTAMLAAALRQAGVVRGDVVAVALPRSLDLVISLVAVLRSGAAYLPIDVTHPAERNALTLRLASPRVAISADASREALPSTLPVVLPTAVVEDVQQRIPVRVEPSDAAYVIYTSGSTGEPKGVVIEHGAIVNRLEWMRSHYGIGETDRILQKTPATFDVSVWEFFLPLLSGAALVVAPPDAHRDPVWLAELIRAHRITTMHFVPSMLELFVAEPSVAGLRLRRVFCSGEALSASLRDRFHQVVDAELHNLYGPTEAAVDVTYWDASRGDASVPVPIGRPVWNTQMYILDSRLRPVPAGVPADLYIGGVQLAREYLGRPDLTADRFVDVDVAGVRSRLYKTGDIAEWRDDGAILFLGRSDHQVKIRGFRIELGDIEAALQASGLVSHAAVVARASPVGEPQLVGYVVPPAGPSLDLESLRQAAQRRLPDYMVPAAFVVLDELPLTRSGKLDRSALPTPAFQSSSGRAAATETERRLAALFAEILGVGDVGADADFFSLGGHSLMAVRLLARMRQTWPCELGLGAVFANPTVAKLAAAIDAQVGADGIRLPADEGLCPLVRLATAGPDAPSLFCIHPAGGISWCYGQLARALHPSCTVYGLQAPGLDPTRPMPATLDDLAHEYVELVRRTDRRAPFHVIGWSVGGIIAHAMAVRLQELGETVGTLVMLDAYPSDRWRGQPEPEAGAALRALLLIAGHDPAAIGDRPLTRDTVIAFLRSRNNPLGELSDEALTGIIRVVEGNNRLVRHHVHRVYRGSVLYFRAALDHQDDGLDPMQWKPYIEGRIDVHDVPSRHAHLTGSEAVARIAPLVSATLAG